MAMVALGKAAGKARHRRLSVVLAAALLFAFLVTAGEPALGNVSCGKSWTKVGPFYYNHEADADQTWIFVEDTGNNVLETGGSVGSVSHPCQNNPHDDPIAVFTY